jgi:tRNA nucleotidyltransferase (CCA-adding enzyme)
MVKNSLKGVLAGELNNINPPEADVTSLNQKTKITCEILKNNINRLKLNANVFIGGSFAKNTLIKKQKYDVDIFVRFDSSYSEEKIALYLSKIVPKNAERIHGSRDYFIIKDNSFEFEIIPTIKIKRPSEAKNITDLSYFHVNYVKNKLKNKKLASEIRLSKAFIHYADCYGAESYINGFSGYAVELLIIHYKSLIKFIEAIAKFNVGEKIVLDPAKLFKNKQEILRTLNAAKLNSPIVLIDPTFRERNALAALSIETFIKFQDYCKRFLKNPNAEFFKIKDKEAIMRSKYGADLLELQFFTDKQSGDIAGTKLKKFSGFFMQELSRYFDIQDSGFIYYEKTNTGKLMLVIKQKKEIIFPGPPVAMKDRLIAFKREHKKIKIIKGKAQASENPISFEKFFDKLLNKKRDTIEGMGVSEIKLL